MLAHSGRDEDAALLLGAADSIFIPPISHGSSENRGADTCCLDEHLGDDRLAEVLARGATMTDDEAVAYARTKLEAVEAGRPPNSVE